MSKRSNEIDEYVDNLTPSELGQALAVVKNITTHLKPLETALRNRYTNEFSQADDTSVSVDGQPVAKLTMTREGKGRYVVKDMEAYGAILHDINAELDGGYPAVEEKWMPKPEACTDKYLDALIHAHGGEVPAGVEYKEGRAATVVVSLTNRDGFPITLNQLNQTLLKEIEA